MTKNFHKIGNRNIGHLIHTLMTHYSSFSSNLFITTDKNNVFVWTRVWTSLYTIQQRTCHFVQAKRGLSKEQLLHSLLQRLTTNLLYIGLYIDLCGTVRIHIFKYAPLILCIISYFLTDRNSLIGVKHKKTFFLEQNICLYVCKVLLARNGRSSKGSLRLLVLTKETFT